MLSTKLHPAELENNFRRDILKHDVKQISVAIILAFIPISLFVLNDILTFSDIELFEEIIISRIGMTIWSLVVIYIIRTTRSILVVDRVILIWMIGASLLALLISYSRPGDYLPVTVLNMIYIMAIYVLFPIPLYLQVIAGVLISLGECILIAFFKSLPVIPGGIIMLILGFTIANLFGFVASYRLCLSRRKQFVLLHNELEIKANLQYALSEVKTLRGIIPICMSCRKIRNDEGYYEVVERYLKRHSDVDFSHTLCPDCFSEKMDELEKEY